MFFCFKLSVFSINFSITTFLSLKCLKTFKYSIFIAANKTGSRQVSHQTSSLSIKSVIRLKDCKSSIRAE